MGEKVRKAKNEAIFREVNQRIEKIADEFDVPGEATFVCECGDAGCTERVNMTLGEDQQVRADGARFAVLPGHDDPSVERVVERNQRFAVVEKVGVAADVARSLDRD